jgi:hypothetical protein
VLPPVPVHDKTKLAVFASGPTGSLPEVAFAPLQPPLAVHDVALVDDQVSVEVPLTETEVGFADSVTVGAGGGAEVTLTVTFFCVVPPEPVQLSVNVEFAVSVPVD